MLSNYIKITFAVMRRRKFFTFISLFGISFTLLILILLTAFLEHLLGPNYPEWNRNDMAYISRMRQQNSEKGYSNTGPISYSYAQRYIKPMKTVEKVGLSSFPQTINTYAGNQKFRLYYRYTDATFWEVTQFEFLEGRPYTQQDMDQNAVVAVINDHTRDSYFGKNASALGKTIEIQNVNYRVVGVVRGVPTIRVQTASDVWMPVNTSKIDLKTSSYNGTFSALVLPKAGESIASVTAEYSEIVSRLKPNDPEEFDKVISEADTYMGAFTRTILGGNDDDGVQKFFLLLSVFALLFMSIPALNLINLNISRILERASEIGVRRACGASAKNLIVQFTVESVLISLIGGLIALVLAGIAIYLFNHSDFYAYGDLRINWRVALIAIALSLIFGLMSGVYPAWRMSKLPPAEALR